MKFKLDENIPILIVHILDEYGFSDVETVYSENLAGESDKNIGKICLEEDRIIITLDNDFSNRLIHPKGSNNGVLLLKSHLQGKKVIKELIKNFLDTNLISRLPGNVLIYDKDHIRIVG